jgi:hypothetical protein
MTVNGFKHLCMVASTEEAKRIRDYYVAMEAVVMKYTKRRLEQSEAQCTELRIQLEAQVQDASCRARHDALVASNLDRPVVYLARVSSRPDGRFLLKIGETNDIKQRVGDHRSEFGPTFVLLDVISCIHAHRLEQQSFRLPELHGRKVTEPLGRSQREHREVFAITPAEYKRLLVAIGRLQSDIEREDHVQSVRAQMVALQAENERWREQQEATMARLQHELDTARAERDRGLELKRLEVAAMALASQRVADDPPAAPRVLRNPDRRFTHARGQKVQQYTFDGRLLIKTHAGFTEAMRAVPELTSGTLQCIKNAAGSNKIYKGFRWAMLDRSEPDDTVQDLPTTIKSRQQTRDLIAMLNLNKDKIERVFCDMKAAAEDRHVKMSTMSAGMARGSRCSGFFFKPWFECPDHMRAQYLGIAP